MFNPVSDNIVFGIWKYWGHSQWILDGLLVRLYINVNYKMIFL